MRGGHEPRDNKDNTEETNMKITFNVKGAERKSLAGAISMELNAPTKYLGMPTAAYEIGGYHIDKNGTVTGEDNSDLVKKLEAQGFTGEVEYADLPPCEGEGPEPSAEVEEEAYDNLVVEIPLTGFTPEKLDNLVKLVNAKDTLLKMALEADDLPIKQTADTLQFPWFKGAIDAEHAKAYSTLISLLCKTALKKKRVTAKEKEIDGSPKFAFRCFLLTLGFIGVEYKAARKILLSRLSGNSSWKNGKKPEAVSAEEIQNSPSEMPEEALAQILKLRTLPGCPNMFDTHAVQRFAFDNDFYDLVNFIEADRKAYANFILTGNTNEAD
jgi:hypothetical protein